MATLNQLAKLENLNLAWERILSGQNHKYKKYFREIYNTYDLSIETHLLHLEERIKGGSYKPQSPIVIHEPKPNGLTRPISLLTIEDQIVLQAIANLFADKFSAERKKQESRYVFSNILDRESGSIFFFEKWIDSYNKFQIQCQNIYLAGSKWMMDFDLAAFYDSISHQLLIKKLIPKKQNSLQDFLFECFGIWTSTSKNLQKGHGIPQGPLASDFIAEVFLHEIDKLLIDNGNSYIRYVDDFRFFGFTKRSVLDSLHQADIICKKHGLIPQSAKLSIRKISSVNDFKTFDESGDPEVDAEEEEPLLDQEAENIFFESVNIETGIFQVKSGVKYVLKRAGSNFKLKAFVLQHLTKNLQFTEEIFTFFENYIDDKQVFNRIKDLINNRFDFVRSHAWFFICKSNLPFQEKPNVLRTYIDAAIAECKKDSDNTLSRMGAFLFLIKCEEKKLGKFSNFILSEPTWFNKAILARELSARALKHPPIIKAYFGKNHFEPSLMLGPRFHHYAIPLKDTGISVKKLMSQTKNTFKELGLVQTSSKTQIDPVGEILSSRYDITHWTKWKDLLGFEYEHALGILKQGDRMYYKSRDKWLSDQNSFNNTLFLMMIETLDVFSLPGGDVDVNHPNGGLKSFGTLTSTHNMNEFVKTYPEIAEAFHVVNDRRNGLPGSHPYDLRNHSRTKPLAEKERGQIHDLLATAYEKIITLFDTHI